MNKTKIAWTERTWNPVTGCTKISEGCRHCYAEVMAKRLQGMGQKRYKNGFTLTLHPEALNEPKKVKEPSMFFVCSMADLGIKDAIGIEELVFVDGDINKPHIVKYPDQLVPVTIYDLATNDGLSVEDWLDWFKGYDLTKPLAVLHFTDFRYT